jgi:hypothetical protein
VLPVLVLVRVLAIWIIKEPIEGRYYPCKPDVFVKKYEKVVLK